MPLSVGTKAPDFTLPTKTVDGPKQIKLMTISAEQIRCFFFPNGVHRDLHDGNVRVSMDFLSTVA